MKHEELKRFIIALNITSERAFHNICKLYDRDPKAKHMTPPDFHAGYNKACSDILKAFHRAPIHFNKRIADEIEQWTPSINESKDSC